MATFVKQRGKSFQLRVIHRLLPKPFHFTFPTKPEADAYGEKLVSMLERGVVPQEMLVTDTPLMREGFGKAGR